MPTLWTEREFTRGFLMLVVLLSLVTGCVAQSSPAGAPATATVSGSETLSVKQIVAAMMKRNEARASELRGYTGRRVYQLRYRGFPGNKNGELIVEARYRAPSTKEFTVVSQHGSKFIVNKILRRLLASEQEAQSSENRQKTALTPHNYHFELQGEEVTDQGRFYVLKVEPKVRNKFLYRGEIWVDASDFAVARIEAEPAKNPSLWISNTQIEQKYAKFGTFWLPVRNQSTSKVRFFGGTATLVIEYQDYKLSNEDQKAEAALTKLF